MPDSYRPARPTSGTLGSALSRVADAVEAHIDDVGVRATAAQVGASKSALHAWGSDLSSWSALHLLTLARQSPDVLTAIVALLADQIPAPAQPLEAINDGHLVVGELASAVAVINNAISDRKFTHKEKCAVADAGAVVQRDLPKFIRNMLAAPTAAEAK